MEAIHANQIARACAIYRRIQQVKKMTADQKKELTVSQLEQVRTK